MASGSHENPFYRQADAHRSPRAMKRRSSVFSMTRRMVDSTYVWLRYYAAASLVSKQTYVSNEHRASSQPWRQTVPADGSDRRHVGRLSLFACIRRPQRFEQSTGRVAIQDHAGPAQDFLWNADCFRCIPVAFEQYLTHGGFCEE